MTDLQTRLIQVTAPFGKLAATVVDPVVVHEDAARPVVVVWPSVLSTAAVQSALVEELAGDSVVVAIDPPGHGASHLDDATALSMTACAHATWDLVDKATGHLTGRAVCWVGTSWGGLVGVEAARAHPERVAHLACLNTPFLFEPPTALRPAWLPLMARVLGTTSLFAELTARSFFLPATRRDAEHAGAMAAHRVTFTDGDRRQLAAALRLLFVRRHDARAQLAATTVPLLVIAGARDGMYPLEDQRRAAEQCPGAIFEVVESAHIAAVDATAAVSASLRGAWLAEGLASGAGA